MKNRTSLVLMEQLVMVLVFALAAALCLGVFVRADAISRETAYRDEAVLLAQNGAETLKSCSGDPVKTAAILGGTVTEKGLNAVSGDYITEIEFLMPEVPGLAVAQIRIFRQKELLFELRTGWQEVGG